MSSNKIAVRYTAEVKQQCLEAKASGLTSQEVHELYGPTVNSINKWVKESKGGTSKSPVVHPDTDFLFNMATKDPDFGSMVLEIAKQEPAIKNKVVTLWKERQLAA